MPIRHTWEWGPECTVASTACGREWDKVETHQALIDRLSAEFDAWVLSLTRRRSERSYRFVLMMCGSEHGSSRLPRGDRTSIRLIAGNLSSFRVLERNHERSGQAGIGVRRTSRCNDPAPVPSPTNSAGGYSIFSEPSRKTNSMISSRGVERCNVPGIRGVAFIAAFLC